MPELPDVVQYCNAIERFVGGQTLKRIRLGSPFVLRSVEPPVNAAAGKRLLGTRRLGKRIVLELEDELFVVIHLMIAGRLRWRSPGVKVPRRRGLAGFDFERGTILFTEEGSRKRASIHMVRGEGELYEHDPGGIDVLSATRDQFGDRLRLENHTLKRCLTDPRLFSGIGNAYSDEILHRARLSPMKWSSRLSIEEADRLHEAARSTLNLWIALLAEQLGDDFPEKVTAFHPEMAVHGRYGQSCPRCGSPVQRIVYAENEANYCATCQTGGKVLKDRALSQLLKDDWPRTVEGWEELKGG